MIEMSKTSAATGDVPAINKHNGHPSLYGSLMRDHLMFSQDLFNH